MSKKRREKRCRPVKTLVTLNAHAVARVFLDGIESNVDFELLGRRTLESAEEARARTIRLARRFATVAEPDVAARLERASARLEADGPPIT